MSARPFVPRPATPPGVRAQGAYFLWWLRQIAFARIPLPPTDNTKDIARHPFFLGPLSRGFWRFAFVRITRAGRWFFFFTFALTLLGVTSLEVQTYIVLLYCTALWAVASVVSWFVRPSVVVRTVHAPRARVGETVPVRVEVTNGKRPALDLYVVPSRLPMAVDSDPPGGVSVGTLAARETRQVTVGLRPARRGVYTLRGWRLETDFPFGLINAYREFAENSELVVHPNFMPLSRLDMPHERHAASGALVSTRRGDSLEYLGSREFREGDAVRDIDWRATARMGGMPIVREWREEQDKRVGIVLDTAVSREGKRPEHEARLDMFEWAVSLTASVCDYLSMQDYEIEFFAAGPAVYRVGGARRADREVILDALAAVEAEADEVLPGTAPGWDVLVGSITEMVCVFLRWNATRQAFVEDMRQQGIQVKVIVVTTESDGQAPPADAAVVDAARWAAGVSEL